MELRTVHVGDLTEVHAAGRLDGHWSETLDTALNELIRQGRHQVRLRMAEVDYISSLGVRVLVTAHKRFRSVSGVFSVADVVGNVARVLELAGLTALLMPPEPPAAADGAKPLREIEHNGLRLSVFGQQGRGMRGAAFGAPASLRSGGYGAEQCIPLTVTAQTLSLGLGAFGEDYAQCRTRFGEYLAVAGAAVALPGDGSNTCDSLVSTGAFEPVVQALYGLRYEGDFSAQVRFEPAELSNENAARNPVGSTGFPLSSLADAALTAAGVDAACVVLLGESDGLIGATLRSSPGSVAAAEDPLAFPTVRRWLSFTSEPAHARASVVAVGVIARPGVLSGLDAELLRPLGARDGVQGHVHAAVYRFRPLPHGALDLNETLRPLFEHAPAETLMHLLGDDREGQMLESRLVRGVCWIAPILSAEDLS